MCSAQHSVASRPYRQHEWLRTRAAEDLRSALSLMLAGVSSLASADMGTISNFSEIGHHLVPNSVKESSSD